MLEVKDLKVAVNGSEILRGLNLSVKAGEIHAIMGPNGSGKSTLSKVLAGHPDYEVTSGSVSYEINFRPRDLLALSPEERAQDGVFLAFQYPTEIPGVSNAIFLREAFNAVCRRQGVEEMDPLDFDEFLREKMKFLGIDTSFIDRNVNVDFSGGETKRNEIVQLAILNPRLAILDETDSGLDVDSLRTVAEGVNKLKTADNAMILITHYQRILDYIVPDFVHVLHRGQIVCSGDKNLAMAIEAHGFEHVLSAN